MNEIIQILLSALGVIVTGLVSWGLALFTKWLNSKISDKQAANYITTIMTIVGDAVKSVYQTYVETLKAEGKFDKEAQEKALEMCMTQIKANLAPDLIDYITKNFGDMSEYLKTLIESSIYSLKQIGKAGK